MICRQNFSQNYKDMSVSGGYDTRLIVLNQFDYSGADLDLSDAKCYMSQTQVDWLLDILDDAIANDKIVILDYHEKEEYSLSDTARLRCT